MQEETLYKAIASRSLAEEHQVYLYSNNREVLQKAIGLLQQEEKVANLVVRLENFLSEIKKPATPPC